MRNIIIKEVEGMSNNQTRRMMRWNSLITRQAIKTSALWVAAEIMQEKLEPNKTVDQVYEMLKLLGKQELIKKKPELKPYIR